MITTKDIEEHLDILALKLKLKEKLFTIKKNLFEIEIKLSMMRFLDISQFFFLFSFSDLKQSKIIKKNAAKKSHSDGE